MTSQQTKVLEEIRRRLEAEGIEWKYVEPNLAWLREEIAGDRAGHAKRALDALEAARAIVAEAVEVHDEALIEFEAWLDARGWREGIPGRDAHDDDVHDARKLLVYNHAKPGRWWWGVLGKKPRPTDIAMLSILAGNWPTVRSGASPTDVIAAEADIIRKVIERVYDGAPTTWLRRTRGPGPK